MVEIVDIESEDEDDNSEEEAAVKVELLEVGNEVENVGNYLY